LSPNTPGFLARAASGLAFLGVEKLAQVSYYHQTRDQVWQYQRDHNISGLIIETLEFNGNTIRFPMLSDQLIATADDMDVMRASKARVVSFFADFCQNNPAFISHEIYSKMGGQWPMETTLAFALEFAGDMEWAIIREISDWYGAGLRLELGYGDMRDAPYIASKESESWIFEASTATKWTDPRTIQTAKPVTLGFDEIKRMRRDRTEGDSDGSDKT
jgi:hypothetical protein